MGCAKCNSGFTSTNTKCSKCNAGFTLCNNCKGTWKGSKCPKCGTLFANWSGL